MRKLEELLNLPDAKEILKSVETENENLTDRIKQVQNAVDNTSIADNSSEIFDHMLDTDQATDIELNDVAKKSMQSYEDLMDLGMNVEGRHAARIFEVAGQFLRTNLDAKIAKIDKKLKMVELQIKKDKVDKQGQSPDDFIIKGDNAVITDRNSLLERLRNMDPTK